MEPENKREGIDPADTPQEKNEEPVIHLASDARSSPGRSRRTRSVETPADGSRRRSISSDRSEGGPRHSRTRQASLPWKKMAIIGFLSFAGAAVIIASIAISGNRTQKSARAASQTNEKNPVNLPAYDENAADAEALQLINRMETAIRRYCAATTVGERAKYVRRSTTVVPLMKAYYPDGKIPRIPAGPIQFDPLTMEKRADFWFASVEIGQGRIKHFILETPPNGPALIDWEADVVHQPVPWESFIKERPSGISRNFRIHLQKGVLFSHEFTDEAKWKSYRLTAPGSEISIYGYCEAGGEIDLKLVNILRQNSGSNPPVILRLKRPPGLTSPHGAIIEAVASENWIYID